MLKIIIAAQVTDMLELLFMGKMIIDFKQTFQASLKMSNYATLHKITDIASKHSERNKTELLK